MSLIQEQETMNLHYIVYKPLWNPFWFIPLSFFFTFFPAAVLYTLNYKEHLQNGGRSASYAAPLIICISVFVILALWALSDGVPVTKLTYADDELYYTDSVTEQEVAKLGNFLTEAKLFRVDNKPIAANLDRQSGVYIFSLIIQQEKLNSPQLNEFAKGFSQLLSKDVFENQKVEIDLCSDEFQVEKRISADVGDYESSF